MGRTTEQLRACPQDAVYVVPTRAMVSYVTVLASNIGRPDIKFRTLDWLLEGAWRGWDVRLIVVDHACMQRIWRGARLSAFQAFEAYRASRMPATKQEEQPNG